MNVNMTSGMLTYGLSKAPCAHKEKDFQGYTHPLRKAEKLDIRSSCNPAKSLNLPGPWFLHLLRESRST